MTTETKKFEFDPIEHLYTLGGKPMTGVTSVLQVIAKPALIQWAANEAVKYIKVNAPKEYGAEDLKEQLWTGIYLVTEPLLEEAKKAHRKKKEDAGSKGTDVHGEIEKLINEAISVNDGYLRPGWERDERQIADFVRWAVENNVRFLASEKQVYSETHWYAGTLDFICEINGKKFVGDIKTSSGIYGREYFAQCAAYRLALEEMGETGFEGSVVVRLGKDGSFEEKYSYDYETDKKLFLACLDVYRAMGTFNTK